MRWMLFVGLLCGCGGGGGAGAGTSTVNTGAIQSLGDFTAALAKIACAEAYQCCSNPQTFTQTANEGACDVGAAAVFGGLFAQTAADVAGGRIAFDAAKASTCIDAFRSFSCAGERREFVDATCYTYLVGKTPTGGACQGIGAATCEPGSGCWYAPTNHARFLCTKFLAAGAACQLGASLCDYTAGHTCGVEGQCVPLHVDGHSCAANAQCLSGLCQAGKCATVTIANATCNTTTSPIGGGKK